MVKNKINGQKITINRQEPVIRVRTSLKIGSGVYAPLPVCINHQRPIGLKDGKVILGPC
jgi:hypothetical protein